MLSYWNFTPINCISLKISLRRGLKNIVIININDYIFNKIKIYSTWYNVYVLLKNCICISLQDLRPYFFCFPKLQFSKSRIPEQKRGQLKVLPPPLYETYSYNLNCCAIETGIIVWFESSIANVLVRIENRQLNLLDLKWGRPLKWR